MIYVMQGPPAGGKSTKAREIYNEDKLHRVIVNRDSIRDSRGDYWVPEQESYISKLEEHAVRAAIESGLSPIIDATNLNPKTRQKWVDLALEYKVDLTTIECVVPYQEALTRDSNRERPVGKKVLRDFYKRYYPHLIAPMSDDRQMIEFTPGKRKAIIVDIDGTVALRNNRSPFDYARVGEDSVDHRMAHLLRNLICECEEYDVFFVTGREAVDNCREDTIKWINDNIYSHTWEGIMGPEYNWKLFMRDEGDHRSDEIVKKEIYENHIAPYYDVVCVFEDRNRVVKMWRSLGLLVAQVWDGDF
jgi:predicted kinase